MRQDINRKMLEYFKSIPNPNSQESQFIEFLQEELNYFDITGITREDVYTVGYDASSISDNEMEILGQWMADIYAEDRFWVDLESFLEYMAIPKLNDNNK